MDESFFRYQEARLRVLWRWGIVSVLLGLPGLVVRDPFLRHAAIQTSSWGAIDALIAFFGIRGARAKERQRLEGALHDNDEQRDAQRFRLILLLNGLLDIGYIAGGVFLARQKRPDRRGMGIGILPQGVFLFLFDSFLAWDVGRRSR